jgi:hypothetical protein
MPGGDRTGPRGLGPMTGRRAGYCAGSDVPGFSNQVPGYRGHFVGGSRSWGGGHGWRHWFHATGLPFWARGGTMQPTKEQELTGLKNTAERLKDEFDAISRRIEELEQDQ